MLVYRAILHDIVLCYSNIMVLYHSIAYYMVLYHSIVYHLMLFCFDSASLPFKFLNRLPGGCSGGEGTPPETLKCLTPNPYS